MIYEDKSSHKKAESTREQEEIDLGESWLQIHMYIDRLTVYDKLFNDIKKECQRYATYISNIFHWYIPDRHFHHHPHPQSSMLALISQEKALKEAPERLPQNLVTVPTAEPSPEVVG